MQPLLFRLTPVSISNFLSFHSKIVQVVVCLLLAYKSNSIPVLRVHVLFSGSGSLQHSATNEVDLRVDPATIFICNTLEHNAGYTVRESRAQLGLK